MLSRCFNAVKLIMTAKTHNAVAFASLVTIATFYPPENLNMTTLVLSIVCVSVGALIPDMDQAGNNLWNLFPGGTNFGRLFRRIFYRHRTITHSLLGVFIIYSLLSILIYKIINIQFVNPEILLHALMIGYISHLLADSLTEEGLPLLFPFKLTFGIPPIRSIRIKTGRWFENLIVFPSVWVYVIYLINLKKDILFEIFKSVTK